MNMAEQKKKNEIEVLAPAGSFETFQAVIRAGADAVYLGGSQFGARAYANNFEEEELLRAIDYAHIHGREIYLTVNTLFKEEELQEQLCKYLRPYYEQGLDAVIVQDMGALALIRQEFPGLDIHTSTQMTVTGTYGARYMKELGASRVVTAREMSLKEIQRIHEEVDIEIETFVHGALCYCYSGQCLLSSMLGGRSGNRGRCAQPCRLPYEVFNEEKKKVALTGNFVLSPKDLCGIADIPMLSESGVYSLKIEGRMKQAEYAAGVVSLYRKYVDNYLADLNEARVKGMSEEAARAFAKEHYMVEKTDMTKLLDMGNRSGFTDAYYYKNNGKDMITFGKPNHAKTNERLQEEIRKRYVYAKAEGSEIKEKINGILRLKKESPATIELSAGEIRIEVAGDEVQPALRSPLSLEKVEASIKKTGNTPFAFDKLEIEMDSDVFLPVQAINQLRREALEQLELAMLSDKRRTYAVNKEKYHKQEELSQVQGSQEVKERYVASVEQRSQAKSVLGSVFVDAIYYDSSCYDRGMMFSQLKEDVDATHEAGKRVYFILPAIFRKRTAEFYEKHLRNFLELGLDGVVVKSYDAAFFAKEHFKESMPIILDHSVYIWNREAKKVLWEFRPLRDTVPLELNHREILARNNESSETLIYGYLPLMTSAQCVHANTSACDKHKTVTYLKDRYGKFFPVKNNCSECYNTIYNTTPMVLFGSKDELNEAGISTYRLAFTVEDATRVQEILHICEESFLSGKKNFKELLNSEYTNGHYKRGVE